MIVLPSNLREFSQLEVFHWMIEWATRPYYTARRAVYESRVMEAILINALAEAEKKVGQHFYLWHGNLLDSIKVGHDDIPYSWNLAKRRYLERCVDLYNNTLATAGTHTNLSLPEPLLMWDFMHLKPIERGGRHLDEFKSEFYITATRLFRAFAALFIATGASTPFQVQIRKGNPVVVLTDRDSIRNLTFPNPPALDVADLYRSYNDYLQLSYELVRTGIRFGNNNWTPVRARSFAEPVERLIAVTSEQLQNLYSRGLYSIGSGHSVEEMARQIEMQNLMARINLPMARVEIRTDDGGQPLDIEVANITLKHLLLLLFYADPMFARAFRYDREDLARARHNEEQAAWYGLDAEIDNPLTGKPVQIREFLAWILSIVKPLAEALELWIDLEPLVEMAQGGLNTADRMRDSIISEIGPDGIVSPNILVELVNQRKTQVLKDLEVILLDSNDIHQENGKLEEIVQKARLAAQRNPRSPVRFQTPIIQLSNLASHEPLPEIVELAQNLIRIPSVTACPNERLSEVLQASLLVNDYLQQSGLDVRYYDSEKYPAVLASFPGKAQSRVMLVGHFDVVEPDPDETQFIPRIEGDYIWGRGSADMKTVVATYLVWMKERMGLGSPYPSINLLLVGNEENGEVEPSGTPHILRHLQNEEGYIPEILIAGERTGEKGHEIWTEICSQNRGVVRFDVVARGLRGHSGVSTVGMDLSDKIVKVRTEISRLCAEFLTLKSQDGWQSQVRFPFIQVGTPGIYNVTPEQAVLGVEIRPIPDDDLEKLLVACSQFCESEGCSLRISVNEKGITCDQDNSALLALVQAIKECSGERPQIGRKLPATSARFAPRGQGVVWGQSGINPHGRDERHFIPSIMPYFQALNRFSEILSGS
jgi:succinyl-diaminopimelate desuccinylase